MPNWCKNVVKFNSDEDLQKAVAFINAKAEKDFSFNAFIPRPKTAEECPPEYIRKPEDCICEETDYPFLNWYNWDCDKWGTKWDACDVQYWHNEIWFDTAWNHPEPVLKKMGEVWKDFDFSIEFCEEQPAFAGDGYHNAGEDEIILDVYDCGDELYETYNDVWGDEFVKDEETGEWKFIDSDGEA